MFILRRAAVRTIQLSSHQTLKPSTSRLAQAPRLIQSNGSSISALRSFTHARRWAAEEPAKASPAEVETRDETVTTEPSPSEAEAAANTAAESASSDAVAESAGTTAIGDSSSAPGEVAAVDSSQPTETSSGSPEDALAESSGTTSEPLGQAETSGQETEVAAPPSTESEAAAVPEVKEESMDTSSSVLETAQEKAADAAQAVGGVAAAAAGKAREAFDSTATKLQDKKAEFPPRVPAPVSASSQQQPATGGRQSAGGRETFGSRRSEAPPSKILYVGNLFFEVTAPILEKEFSRFGSIVNSRVVTDQRGLSKGFGYVEFSEQGMADQAVRELDQKVLEGRRMAVQYHVQRAPRTRDQNSGAPREGGFRGMGGNQPSKTLFIGNMSYQMSDRDLNDLFREIHNVLDVRVAIDRRSGQPRGFAHADFIDVDSARKAKEVLERKVIYGRGLRVDFSANSSESASSSGGQGRAPRGGEDSF